MRPGPLSTILMTFIAEGHIKKLAPIHKACIEDPTSEPQARDNWVEFIMDLSKEYRENEWTS